MRVDLFDFDLPADRIADRPCTPRDQARLLHVTDGGQADLTVGELPSLLRRGDVVVFNDTRVIPARLLGRRGEVAVEILLHKRLTLDTWEGFARPAKRLRPGQKVEFPGGLSAEVLSRDGPIATLRFNTAGSQLMAALETAGHIPLPPYIRRADDSRDRTDYQTVYAAQDGAVAAPTAGLHFTPELLAALDDVAAESGASLAQIALAWLLARPGVTSPVVSATSLDQLERTLTSVELALSPGHIAKLDAASAAD